jgi:hypothetical protein
MHRATTAVAIAVAIAVVVPAAARVAAPKLVDKGAIPALAEVKGELPADGPLEEHRFHFENPRGQVSVSVDATFGCELFVSGPKTQKNETGKSVRLDLDEAGDLAITVAPGRGERGGKFTLKVSGAWQCGGVAGYTCPKGTRCAIVETHPDAMGSCEREPSH